MKTLIDQSDNGIDSTMEIVIICSTWIVTSHFIGQFSRFGPSFALNGAAQIPHQSIWWWNMRWKFRRNNRTGCSCYRCWFGVCSSWQSIGFRCTSTGERGRLERIQGRTLLRIHRQKRERDVTSLLTVTIGDSKDKWVSCFLRLGMLATKSEYRIQRFL